LDDVDGLCDGCPKGYRDPLDGKIQSLDKIKNNVETESECSIENSLETEFLQMPSPPSPKRIEISRLQKCPKTA